MKRFWAGIVAGLFTLPLLFLAYAFSGYLPATTADPPMPGEQLLAGPWRAAMKREAPSRDTSGFSTADLVSGAAIYRKNCAVCHGVPGKPSDAMKRGMYPHPPQLFEQEDLVTDDPAGQTYWKVKNGIRLTGMPSFQTMLSDEQMWQVTAVIARADKLPSEALDALNPPATTLAEPTRGESKTK